MRVAKRKDLEVLTTAKWTAIASVASSAEQDDAKIPKLESSKVIDA